MQWRKKNCVDDVYGPRSCQAQLCALIPDVRWLNFPSNGPTVDSKVSLTEKEALKNSSQPGCSYPLCVYPEAPDRKFFSNVAIAKYGALTAGCNT